MSDIEFLGGARSLDKKNTFLNKIESETNLSQNSPKFHQISEWNVKHSDIEFSGGGWSSSFPGLPSGNASKRFHQGF